MSEITRIDLPSTRPLSGAAAVPRTGNTAIKVFMNHAISAFPVHRPSDISSGANEAATNVFHESRNTRHESRLFLRGRARVAPPETAVRTTASAGKSLFASSPLFTIVHDCSPLFGKKYCWEPVSPRRPVAASLGAFARHGAASSGYRAACAGGVGGKPVSVPRPPFSVGLAASAAAGQLPLPRAKNEPMLRKGCVPDSVGAPRRHLCFGATRWAFAD